MTTLIPRKRFFSQESGSLSTSDLPLLSHVSNSSSCSSSSSSTSSCISEDEQVVDSYESSYPNRCESPPASGNYNSSSSSYAMDYNNNRSAPGRASSMSIVRQRSGVTLSPQAKHPPRKSVSMFFSSSTESRSDNSSMDYHQSQSQQTSYGMLNPGKSSFLRRSKFSNAHKYYYNGGSMMDWITTTLALLAFLTLSCLTWSAWQHNTQLQHEIAYREREIDMHLDHSHMLERKVQKMRVETIHLQDRIEELENPQPTEQELSIQRKIFHLEHYQDQLHKGIAEQAKQLVFDKYGPGPKYYIEMKLAFDSESNIVQDATTEIEDTIWIETAHIDEMPHTVHFFLEQVSHGVFDGTSFYRNAPRFLQAGPGHNEQTSRHIEQHLPSLKTVLFQEHSSNLNHQQYTLGYPGRPGGPDFYLNLQDNSDQHGLGVVPTSRSHMMEEADPCFARIIRGFSTMERIHRSNVLDDDEQAGFTRRKQHRMVHPVTIVSMKVHNVNNDQQSQAR